MTITAAGLLELAATVRVRVDQLDAKATEAEKHKSPNVIALLFAAVELHKVADEAERLATFARASDPTLNMEADCEG